LEQSDVNSLAEIALKVLLDAIEQFKSLQSNMDVVNMAKSKEFVSTVKDLLRTNYFSYLQA
jgi:hypothetical protein